MCSALESCVKKPICQLLDIEVGKKNNLGEIKSFVLLQVLSVMLGEQIYVFCSDDKNARNGATNFEDVRCISLVSVFSRLKEESNWTLADAEPYIESLIAFYQDHHQTTFRVMEASEVRRLQRIPCRQVLQEIFDGKFIELKNGMLSELVSCLMGQNVTVLEVFPNEDSQFLGVLVIMDMVVRMSDGSIANIEIQKISYDFPAERISCYSADLRRIVLWNPKFFC